MDGDHKNNKEGEASRVVLTCNYDDVPCQAESNMAADFESFAIFTWKRSDSNKLSGDAYLMGISFDQFR